MDDIRPRPQRQNVNTYPNRVSNQPNPTYNQPSPIQSTQGAQSTQDITEYPNHEIQNDLHLPEAKPKKSGKGKTFALVLFILLFIASAGAVAYLYFIVMPQMQKDYDEVKADNARLIQRIDSLEYDNRDLQQKLQLQQSSEIQEAGAENNSQDSEQ
jgi:hypothetical protein